MEIFSALLALCAGKSPVTGEFPSQRPVTRSFDVFFDFRLNKRLSKQTRRRWFETPSRSLWRHCIFLRLACSPCNIFSRNRQSNSTDLSYKSHNAPVPYFTIHHSVTEICTWLYSSVTKWCIVGYLSDAVWNLRDASMELQGSISQKGFMTQTL